MDEEALGRDLVVDLLRSAWIIEAARVDVYREWGHEDSSFEASVERSTERARLVGDALEARGRRTDPELVAPHAAWIRRLIGDSPGEVALGDLFLVRVGDWVDAHAAGYVADASRLRELGEQERVGLTWPDRLPPPPPFEQPLLSPEVEPPGKVRLRFGILGDLHLGSERAADMARAAIADLNRSGAELVIQLGDITDHGDPDEFEQATEVLAELRMPVITMLGNHDIYSIKEGRLSGREVYPRTFGREPDGIIVEQKGMRLAVLDSAMNAASPFPAYDLVTGSFSTDPSGAVVQGSLTPAQHEILADVAAPGSGPAFVFLHHPPQPYTGFPPVIFGLRDQDSRRLHAAVDSGNVWGVFAGHTHRNARTREFDGVPSHEVAAARDYPCGYALVDVTERGYAYRFVQLSNEPLLRRAYESAGTIFRRYASGTDAERAFVWTRADPQVGRSVRT